MDIQGIFSKAQKEPKKRKTSTNSTTSQIINYLDEIGWASRINIVAIQRNGKYTSSNMKLGIPDIIGCYKGQFIGVEVKTGKDKLSVNQIKCHSRIIERGLGEVLTVNSFEDFKQKFEEWKIKMKL